MSHTKDKLARSLLDRRDFLRGSGIGAAALIAARNLSVAESLAAQSAVPSFELDEATIAQLQEWMTSGRFSARVIAEMYLKRIEEIDKNGPAVNSVIEVNPDALTIADSLDSERKQRGPRGPLHGIPILLKDNIDTGDKMATTAGSLALAGCTAPRDSFLAHKLREAGAVILGKTNLSEWANFRSTHSSSGWSGRGGQTKNPYALDRNPCGSSSGSGAAVAANLCAAAIGTETDGSIVCPSNANSIVGIKPTLGLVSRTGIIPIAHSQDTAGPMARTVADAVTLLGAITALDPRDPASRSSRSNMRADYTVFLDKDGLKGARIGVARNYFGFNSAVDKLIDEAIDVMKQLGAVIIDPADIATAGKFDDSELEVLLYEFKADLNAYLKTREGAKARSLKELIDFNEHNRDKEMPYFGQELFIRAEAKRSLASRAYRSALAKNHRLSRSLGIDAAMKRHRLDALVAPTGSPPWPTDLVNGDHFSGGSSTAAAVAGYPNINVPTGYVYGLPIGVSFFGKAYSEPTLIRIAYAFEQGTKHRRPPRFLPTANVQLKA